MNTVKSFLFAAALAALAGCGGGGGGQGPMGQGGAGGAVGGGGAGGGGQAGITGAAGQPTGGGGSLSGVTLIEWVDGLAENHTNATSAPDTVDDKAGVIMYTEDPAAFDPLLQKQPQ